MKKAVILLITLFFVIMSVYISQAQIVRAPMDIKGDVVLGDGIEEEQLQPNGFHNVGNLKPGDWLQIRPALEQNEVRNQVFRQGEGLEIKPALEQNEVRNQVFRQAEGGLVIDPARVRQAQEMEDQKFRVTNLRDSIDRIEVIRAIGQIDTEDMLAYILLSAIGAEYDKWIGGSDVGEQAMAELLNAYINGEIFIEDLLATADSIGVNPFLMFGMDLTSVTSAVENGLEILEKIVLLSQYKGDNDFLNFIFKRSNLSVEQIINVMEFINDPGNIPRFM